MSEIDVCMKHLALKIHCSEQHRWFWDQVNNNQWEMDTLQAMDENIDGETLYIDIGTWIGPTVLYAGSRAKRVVAVEPDPFAMAALIENLDRNPAIRDKVTLHNHALGRDDGRLDLWAYRFGDSMTSLLPGRGARRMTFLTMGVDPFFDSALDQAANVFIKVDIEGGEYSLIPALCASLRRRRVAACLYVSLHGSFLVDAAKSAGNFTSSLRKNADLLDALAAYGTLHSYQNGRWQAHETDLGASYIFDGLRSTGGLDTTLLVKPHLPVA